MGKRIGAWYVAHPRDGHTTVIVSAGGFVHLVCPECGVEMTTDEVEAGFDCRTGNPVEVRYG